MNILERIKELEENVESLRIIDTEDIIAEDTGLGIALHLEDHFADSEDNDAYNGYFKVIQTAPNKIKIVDGNGLGNAKCGYATINDIVFNVNASAELTITANAFIYLQSIATKTGDDWIAQTPTFEQSASYPSYEENKFKRLITNVSFADSKITAAPQQQHGAINGDTSGECT